MEAERERRAAAVEKRIDKVEQEIKNVVAANGEELDNISERLNESQVWQAGHDSKDEERWTSNGEKWSANDKRFDGVEFKLNSIIGTSVLTLLSICGFFIAIWIDRQEEKAVKKAEIHSNQTVQNQ